MSTIPEKFMDLFQRPVFAHLATITPRGVVQVNPVWVDLHDGFVRFNSARGRQKDKNIRGNPRVSLSLQDPDNPYRYLEVRGRVVQITEEGANAVIDGLAKKYLGVDVFPFHTAQEVRVTYLVQPERCVGVP
jgi:PPOX class probable F420-dependent enzyme